MQHLFAHPVSLLNKIPVLFFHIGDPDQLHRNVCCPLFKLYLSFSSVSFTVLLLLVLFLLSFISVPCNSFRYCRPISHRSYRPLSLQIFFFSFFFFGGCVCVCGVQDGQCWLVFRDPWGVVLRSYGAPAHGCCRRDAAASRLHADLLGRPRHHHAKSQRSGIFCLHFCKCSTRSRSAEEKVKQKKETIDLQLEGQFCQQPHELLGFHRCLLLTLPPNPPFFCCFLMRIVRVKGVPGRTRRR